MKTRNSQAYDEYVKRLRPVLALDTQWHKTDEDLEAAVRKDTGVVVRNSSACTFRSVPRPDLHFQVGPRCRYVMHD